MEGEQAKPGSQASSISQRREVAVTSMARLVRRLFALLLGLLLLASGCGDSETTVDPGVTRLLYGADETAPTRADAARASNISPPNERPPSTETVGGPVDLRDHWGDDLLECDDAPIVEPGGNTSGSNSLELDSDVLSMLSNYGTQNPDTFGGLWLDGGSTGGLLLAVTDDVAPHLENLMADLDGDVRQAPFTMVQVRFSKAELEAAARVLLDRRFLFLDTATVDLERNRVVLELFNPTPEDIEELIPAVDPNRVCITVAISDVPLDVELTVLPQAGGDTLLTCDEASFPAGSLDRLEPLASSDHPAAGAMMALLEAQQAESRTLAGWIVLSAEADRALFAKYDNGAIEVTALATPNGEVWELSGWTFGCDLKVGLPDGIGPVQIFNNPSRPLDQTATSIDVLVSEMICTGGHTMGNRLLGPQVVETESEVILAFAAVKRPGQTYDCPSNPFVSVTVQLDSPLAGRRIVNGLSLPPTPLTAP